jgi:hypothetical protein
MSQSLRATPFSLLRHVVTLGLLVGVAAAPLVVSVVGCGGAESHPPVAPPPPSASASSSEAAVASAPSPPLGAATPLPSAAPPPPAPVATSAVATIQSNPAWAGCHQSYKAKGKDVANDVAAMAKGCAATTQMKQMGKTIAGKQAAEDLPQSFPFEAKGGHCYRVYAQAVDAIQDLDVVVKDSAGIVVGQDSTDDPSPVVMEDGAVCFSKDDKASVVVSVGMGKGSYAAQIWAN